MKSIVKTILLTLGFLSLSFGLIGIFIPLLPTTPFLLLAAYLFARSSPRYHQWLRNNRFFGNILRDWESGAGLTRNTKWRIMFLATLFIGVSLYFCPSSAGRIALVVVWCIPLGVILLTKTKQSVPKV